MQAAGGEEGTATDGQTATLVAQVVRQIREATRAREAAEGAAEHKIQAAQLRITPEDVVRWAEIGEWCKRVEFHYQELERAEDEIIKLVEHTPLIFAYTKVADRWAAASQKPGEPEGEQPHADDGARD